MINTLLSILVEDKLMRKNSKMLKATFGKIIEVLISNFFFKYAFKFLISSKKILKELQFFTVIMEKEELEQLFVASFCIQEPSNLQSKRCIFMLKEDLSTHKVME